MPLINPRFVVNKKRGASSPIRERGFPSERETLSDGGRGRGNFNEKIPSLAQPHDDKFSYDIYKHLFEIGFVLYAPMCFLATTASGCENHKKNVGLSLYCFAEAYFHNSSRFLDLTRMPCHISGICRKYFHGPSLRPQVRLLQTVSSALLSPQMLPLDRISIRSECRTRVCQRVWATILLPIHPSDSSW